MKILIADDDYIPRRMLQAVLRKWDYEVVTAGDGEEAWAILQDKDAPTLAVLDWMMPALPGVDVCRRVRARESGPYTYLILLTSKDSKEDVVEGMNAGADDYLTKPFDPMELQVRLRAGRRILDLQEKLLSSMAEIQRQENALMEARQREMEIGAKIQQNLLLGRPPASLSGASTAALSISSQQIGGDFYEFFPHSSHCMDIVVGDVMGKGVPAALLSAALKSHLQRAFSRLVVAERSRLPTPEAIISAVQAEVASQFIGLERYITLSYTRLDLERKKACLVDCGQTATIHFQAAEGRCKLVQGVNMPIGFVADDVYQSVTIPFEVGDLFFFYSDGFTETQNPAGEQFSLDRLVSLITDNSALSPQELVTHVHQALLTYAQSETFEDDLTCVAIRIEDLKPLARESIHVPIEIERLSEIRRLVRRFCTGIPAPVFNLDALHQVELAVSEAAANIFRHGATPGDERGLTIELEAFPEEVVIRLRYYGKRFDPASVAPPSFDGTRESGFGLYFMSQCVDEVRYIFEDDGKNCICLIKRGKG